MAEKARDAAYELMESGFSVLPVTWNKSPHPYLISKAQKRLRKKWYNGRLCYYGSYRLKPFFESVRWEWFDDLFPPKPIYVYWLSRDGVKKIRGYGIAVATGSYRPRLTILDVDAELDKSVANELAQLVSDSIGTYAVSTPHGGIHVYFLREEVQVEKKSLYGVKVAGFKTDIRLDAGYAIVPPTKCFCERCKGKGGVGYIGYGDFSCLPLMSLDEAIRLVSDVVAEFRQRLRKPLQPSAETCRRP